MDCWSTSVCFFKQKTSYEMRIIDWSSVVCSSDLSEPARGSRYRYASHNLRFKLNRAGENAQQFMSRISKAIESDGTQNDEDDLWEYGSVRRDVGSLHIDQLTCQASDLARRNLLAVPDRKSTTLNYSP